MSEIDRSFVRLEEGLIHVRHIAGRGDVPPVVMLHASPGSSRGLEELMRAIHAVDGRRIIAPDTCGNGDSAPPLPDAPDTAYFADALVRLLATMGLDRVDLYGSHTGARTACEVAAAHGERVSRLVLDGIIEYSPAMRAELAAHYAPAMAPDDYGRQFTWAFQFVRDQALHFPHYARDPAHRLMTRAVPSAEQLHASTVEVLKGLTSYHKSYRAAFAYRATQRLPLIGAPTQFLLGATELPTIVAQVGDYAALVPQARIAQVGPLAGDKAAAIVAFLAELPAPLAARASPC
jgi:pimeloyl-ACP methyl ester carboxylesterase